jgi:molybdopterin/thiamine biosynthesis adenylyltransferase
MKYYKELTLRNGYFISPKLQKKICDTTLVFVGCGLASTVATSCARLGFTKFVLVDGDNVEVSNLNRQDFYLSEVGRNKATVIGKRLMQVNPDVKTRIIEKHINSDEVEDVISQGDIVINSADFDEVTYKINEVCNLQNKLSISPLNIGFGTVTSAYTRESVTLSELTEGYAKNDNDYLLKMNKNLNYKLPKYLRKNIVKALTFVAIKGFFPQNIIAAHSSCLAIEHTILRYLDGKRINLAPEVIAIDLEGGYEG